MWKLIHLEWQKNKVSKYIWGAIIVTFFLALFMFAQCYLGIANDAATGVPDSAPGMETMAPQIELFTNLSFLVFTAVMMSSFIITPYKNHTMNLMFSYPIKRKKIVISQMLAVWIFCLVALIICKLTIYSILEGAKGTMHASFALGYHMTSIAFYIQIILKSVLTITIGFIPLFIGKATKSSKATIITAFLLFVVMNGTIGDFSFRGNLAVPMVLLLISLICAYFTTYHIETKDLK